MRPEIHVLRAACEAVTGLDGLTAEEREAVTSYALDLELRMYMDGNPPLADTLSNLPPIY